MWHEIATRSYLELLLSPKRAKCSSWNVFLKLIIISKQKSCSNWITKWKWTENNQL